ncbi:ExeM/NucH family extracellular endonuclease [Idiomarina sp.]|uniref:ExeM/NucH family extracellular endonuclease n=1 Tax=Idiomarina sp. TaxID=1874361 RepID=UPI001E10CF13|nr:ExeM/NucH family extracellular endonuclease [Idiomarina sp.]MCJ8315911.1 ExeM/NucH family extracellular endonuclease [Idiomarina sp.]NQZ15826.1 ExeM/NucH family extracellular endonuclease [Idiomarina sp.]
MTASLFTRASLITALIAAASPFAAVADVCKTDNPNITPINAVQGSSFNSPMVDTRVTVRGIVTASWQAEKELGGFFIESAPDDADDNDKTSEGIFVRTDSHISNVSPKDTIVLSGVIQEVNDVTTLTEVNELTTCGSVNALPAATQFTLPAADKSAFERVEGMRVTLSSSNNEPLTVSGNYNYSRYGFVDVSAGRLWTPSQIVQPGDEARDLAAKNELNRIQMDDNSNQKDPRPLPFDSLFSGPQKSLRTGSEIEPLVGVVSQFNNRYRFQPLDTPQLKEPGKTVVSDTPEKAGGTLRIASFNVLNFFNGNGQGLGFPTPRGADTPEEMKRQQAKIVAAINALNADVIGIMEVENDGFGEHSAIRQLVDALNDSGPVTYYISEPQAQRIGGDQITVGLIYNKDTISASSHALVNTAGAFAWGSRPPLAQTLKDKNTGEEFTVIVNHFKSKGSCPEDNESPNSNQNDGQACWNDLRVKSAEQLTEWIAEEAFPNAVLLGDFNAYYKEDPIRYFSENGFHNPSKATDYSYVYDSQAGALDHIFVADTLKDNVSGVYHLPFNADEPWIYDYRNADFYEPTPYRSSDHDPLVLDLRFSASGM